MHRIRQIIIDIHRRSLWQVLGIYLVGSYVGYEVINELTQGLALPDWVPGFAVVLFVVGLPIVLATAFVQEGLPGQRFNNTPPAPEISDPTLLPDFDVTAAAYATSGEQATSQAAASPAQSPFGHWLLTWKRAVLGGVVAFLLLGLTVAGYMGLRNAGIGPAGTLVAKGALDAREPILIAAFEMPGGDSLLAATVTEAFRVDFEQSTVLSVIDHAYTRDALTRMGRPVDTRLDFALARELAEREGIKAVLGGEIRPAGGSFMVTIRLEAVEGGATLASFRETAADSTQILPTVDLLSKKMRNRIGESLRSIRANAPLAAVTTPSLPALRKYTQAVHAGEVVSDNELAIILLRDALALDTTFAMAWRKLAVTLGNSGAARAEMVHAATRAYELRDRLTERERLLAGAYYHSHVSGDAHAAVAAYRTMLQTWPDDHVALNNIATVYSLLGQHEQAVLSLQHRLAIDSTATSPYVNLIGQLTVLERWDDLDLVIERARARFERAPNIETAIASTALAREDYAAVREAILELRSAAVSAAGARAIADGFDAALHATTGSATEAERLFNEFGRAEERRGVSGGDWRGVLMAASIDLAMRRDPERAIERLDRAQRELPLDALPPLDRPYLFLATTFARAGEPARARAMITAWENAAPPSLRGIDRYEEIDARAWLRLSEGDVEGALNGVRQLDDIAWCTLCRNLLRASAFDAASRPDSAIAAYERVIATYRGYEAVLAAIEIAGVHERLAELYEATGDRDNAIRHAARFTELWQNADADLQPRVRAKRDLIARLRQS